MTGKGSRAVPALLHVQGPWDWTRQELVGAAQNGGSSVNSQPLACLGKTHRIPGVEGQVLSLQDLGLHGDTG